MKNILRFIVYVIFVYAAFVLSDAVYSFFDTIFSVYTTGQRAFRQVSFPRCRDGSSAASCSIFVYAAASPYRARCLRFPGSWSSDRSYCSSLSNAAFSHCLLPVSSTIRCHWSSSASLLSPALSLSITSPTAKHAETVAYRDGLFFSVGSLTPPRISFGTLERS